MLDTFCLRQKGLATSKYNIRKSSHAPRRANRGEMDSDVFPPSQTDQQASSPCLDDLVSGLKHAQLYKVAKHSNEAAIGELLYWQYISMAEMYMRY